MVLKPLLSSYGVLVIATVSGELDVVLTFDGYYDGILATVLSTHGFTEVCALYFTSIRALDLIIN